MAVVEPHIPKGKNMNKRFDGWIHVLCDRIQHIDILRHSGSGWGSRSDPKSFTKLVMDSDTATSCGPHVATFRVLDFRFILNMIKHYQN